MSTHLRTSLRSNDAAARWNFNADHAEITLHFSSTTQLATATAADRRELFHSDDPFAALAWMEAFDLSAMPDARWVGCIAYEFARVIERLPTNASDDLRAGGGFLFRLHRGVALPNWRAAVPAAIPVPPVPDKRHGVTPSRLTARSLPKGAYLAAARRALDYIAAGDVFQINLAQRFSITTPISAKDIWQSLLRDSPAEYGAMIEIGDSTTIISNSPELFFRIDPQPDSSRRIINRPIKGTRPNAPGMFDELSHSAKDRAELAMIVDLQRNDLGRVCEIGSVVVSEPRVIEATPTVFHGVATIEGSLRRDASFADVIRALFPCGSITGCPKVRAMEIIDELEPVARGPYCGAIGYLAADGSAEFNVAIRTMVIKDGIAHVYVGGGIVADSSPEAEYEETLVKARAMLAALGANLSS